MHTEGQEKATSKAGLSSSGVWSWPSQTREHMWETSGQRGGTETGPGSWGDVWRGQRRVRAEGGRGPREGTGAFVI